MPFCTRNHRDAVYYCAKCSDYFCNKCIVCLSVSVYMYMSVRFSSFFLTLCVAVWLCGCVIWILCTHMPIIKLKTDHY